MSIGLPLHTIHPEKHDSTEIHTYLIHFLMSDLQITHFLLVNNFQAVYYSQIMN